MNKRITSCCIIVAFSSLMIAGQGGSRRKAVSTDYDAINVKGDKWFNLDELESTARGVLATNMKSFDQSLKPSVWVDTGNREELVKIHYGSKIGSPYWSVSFDVSGKPLSFEHGFLGEGRATNFERRPVK